MGILYARLDLGSEHEKRTWRRNDATPPGGPGGVVYGIAGGGFEPPTSGL